MRLAVVGLMIGLAGCAVQPSPMARAKIALGQAVQTCTTASPGPAEVAARQRCIAANENRIFNGSPIADLVAVRAAERVRLGEMVAAGRLTASQAGLEMARVNGELGQQARVRDQNAAVAQAQINAANANANASQQANYLEMMRIGIDGLNKRPATTTTNCVRNPMGVTCTSQ